jgi:hypothetical protein
VIHSDTGSAKTKSYGSCGSGFTTLSKKCEKLPGLYKKLFQETREGEAYRDQEGDEDLVHPVRPQHQLLRLHPATEKEKTRRETQNKGKAPQSCHYVSARFVSVRINTGAQLIS